MTVAKYPNLEARILANSVLDPEGSGCWIWVGCKANRYGRIAVRVKGRRTPASKWAHRVAYEAFRGAIPDGMTVDHTCRETYCVNPEHMALVTNVENARLRQSRRRT